MPENGKTKAKPDPELRASARIIKILSDLKPARRAAVMDYVANRMRYEAEDESEQKSMFAEAD